MVVKHVIVNATSGRNRDKKRVPSCNDVGCISHISYGSVITCLPSKVAARCPMNFSGFRFSAFGSRLLGHIILLSYNIGTGVVHGLLGQGMIIVHIP